MNTIKVELEYSPDSLSADEAKNKIKKSLENSGLKVVSFDAGGDTDSSFDKMHSSLPNQPDFAEPDVNSTGAGGMVSPDSSGYPNKDK
ncbi:hypothetical protein ACKA06_16620 [Rossellomorea oryzaecorticis]|uniref:Uncharacterized protein n=1 Tax=Rossellomorea oryzaecorticis TaxID=1396505 RepID=A0ABW8VSR1_9BACI|nr:hypothetical protein [[Bacillus] enclensis]MBH9966903.1 hypothetical protein [[Bacillus] enclensis]QWC23916.1 hypothetical protein KJK41_06110 [Bacillus haikouensis]